MKTLRISPNIPLLWAGLLSYATLFSQKNTADSLYIQWKADKDYEFQIFHLPLSVGEWLFLKGNSWEVMKDFKYNYLGGSFGHMPDKHNETSLMSAGIEIQFIRRFKVGAWILPSTHKCYEGGEGQALQQWVFFFPTTTIYNARRVDEDITCRNYSFSGAGIVVPYKNNRLAGIEFSASAGLLVSKYDVKTKLIANDTQQVNSTVIEVEQSASFSESGKRYGIHYSLNLDFFLGRHFSFFTRLNGAQGTKFFISQKSVACRDVTAELPGHYEQVKGFGLSFGMVFHFCSKEDLKSSGNKLHYNSCD